MDYLLPLWLRQYLMQRQKRGMSDPATLSQPRAHSIHQSFLLILQQPTVTLPSATRSKFPFASTASAFKKLVPRDLDRLKSQEVVRMSIYIMKRSRLEFADPFTSERVHTEGEKFLRQRSRAMGPADSSSQHLQGEATAAQVYLNKDFHIGNSVLHNRSYPTARHVESLIAIAAFCARASALRRRTRIESVSIGLVSPTASALDMASASIAGSKWLAKLGQIMFGGVCAQAGHAHHRRTRASLELLQQQNIELAQKILVEEQQHQKQSKSQEQAFSPVPKRQAATGSMLSSPASVAEEAKFHPSTSNPLRSPGPGSLSHSTSTSALSLSVVSTGTAPVGATSTSTNTSTSTPLNEKWCRHCSRAMSCLVFVAVQESSGALVGAEDLGASLDDAGFASSAMETLNVIRSLSSSTSSLNDSPADRRTSLAPTSDLSRHQHTGSSSPYILFSRSHDHDDDMIRSVTVPPVKASSTLSESLADAFGSELASAGSTDKHPPRGHSSGSSSGSSGRGHKHNRIKKIISAGLQRPTADASDLELVSRTGSGLPSTGMSMESSFTASTQTGSWQKTSPAADENRSPVQSRYSPRLIPTRASSGTIHSPRARLENDLAEAAATPSPGSVSSFSSLPATTIGIQPSLESLASAPASGSRTRSSSSSMMLGEASPHGARSSTGYSHSPASPVESASSSPSASCSASPTRSQSSFSPSPATGSPQNIYIASTRTLPSPSHSSASSEISPQDSQDEVKERAAAAPPVEHHSFYALGIHGQASTDAYAREIEESMSRTPPLDSSRHNSLSTSLGTSALLTKSDSDDEGSSGERAFSHDDGDVEGAEDVDDAIDSVDGARETAAAAVAATRHLDQEEEDSGSRETLLGPDSESEDETSPTRLVAPISNVSASEEEEDEDHDDHDDHDESASEDESELIRNENENENENANGNEDHAPRNQARFTSSSMATRPLSTASSSTLLTDDSFLSSIGTSSSISTHEHEHGEDGGHEGHHDNDNDDDDDDEGEEEGEDKDGKASLRRLNSSLAALSTSDGQALTREERKQALQRLQRRKRRLLVDDAKRKQEQLDRIKAQLELKGLGKIRQQVSFWEEKGVLEQKVVAVVEVDEEPEELANAEAEGSLLRAASKDDEGSSPGHHGSTDKDLQARPHKGQGHASPAQAVVVIQPKVADVTLGEPLSPGNGQPLLGDNEPPKPAARKQGAQDQQQQQQQRATSDLSESDLAVFLSDVD
ncbi:unnamed protein product [Mortierella alpina]